MSRIVLHRSRSRFLMAGLWSSAVLGLGPFEGTAQTSPDCEEPFPLRGRIVSQGDELPIPGASVVLPAYQFRSITDTDGTFTVPSVCTGPLELSVSHLAYGTHTLRPVLQEGEDLTVSLAPQALPLEGITVSVEPVIQELERKRNAFAYKSGSINTAELRPDQIPSSLPAYLAARTGSPLTECGGSIGGDLNCYFYRGRSKEVEVCLDEGPFPGGVPQLRMIPAEEIARLEFFPSIGMMKAYTKGFLRLAAEKPWLLAGPADMC